MRIVKVDACAARYGQRTAGACPARDRRNGELTPAWWTPAESTSVPPARVSSAFQSAQPRARDQAAGSSGRAARKAARAGASEEGPGDDEVGGRVADGGGAEVDHAGEAAVRHEEVAGGDVAVQPDRRAGPGGGEGRLPDGGRLCGVDPAGEGGEAGAGLGVVDGEAAAAVEAVGAGRGAAGGRDRPERLDEGGEVEGEADRVVRRGGSPAGREPGLHRPGEGVARARRAHGEGLRHRQRQVRREDGEPARLLLHLGDVAGGEGKRSFIAGPRRKLRLSSRRVDGGDGEGSPGGELGGDEGAGRGSGDHDPVVGHGRVRWRGRCSGGLTGWCCSN